MTEVASPALSSSSAGDADRALRAARAREKLKKFSKKKATSAAADSDVPSSPALSNADAPIRPSSPPLAPPRRSIEDVSPLPSAEEESHEVILNDSQPTEVLLQGAGEISHQESRYPLQTPERLRGIDELLFESSSASRQNSDRILNEARALAQNQQQTITLLVNEKAGISQQLTSIQDSYDDLEKRYRNAANAQTDLQALQTQLHTARSDLLQAQTQAKDHLAAKDQHEATANSLQIDLTAQSRKAAELETHLEDHRRRIDQLVGQLKAGESEQEEQIKTLESKIKASSSHTNSLEMELSRQRTANSRIKSDLQTLEAEKQTQDALFTQATTAQQALQADHDTLLSQLQEANETLQELQDSVATLRGQLSTVQASLTSSLAEADAARSELAEVSSTLHTLQDDLAIARQTASTAQDRRDALQRDNEELMADLSELRTKTISLTDEKATLQDKIGTMHRAFRDKDAELVATRNDLDQSKNVHADTSAERDVLISQLDEAKAESQRLQLSFDGLAKDVASGRSSNASLAEKVASLESRIQTEQSAKDAALDDAAEAHQALEAAQSEAIAAQEASAALQGDFDGLQERSAEYEKDVQELRQQLSDALAQIDALEATKIEGSPLSDISPLPQTPFAASPLRKRRTSLAPTILTNGGANEPEDWPTSDEEAPLKHADHLRSRLQSSVVEKTDGEIEEEDAEALEAAHEHIRELEHELDGSRQATDSLTKRMKEAERQVEELQASIIVERDKTTRAMAEVFALSSLQRQSDVASQSTSRGNSPANTPPARKQRPPSLHRRSASHLPSLTESLKTGQRSELLPDLVSPRGTTFARSSSKTAFAPLKSPSIVADRSTALLSESKAKQTPHARHARRESLSHLKTRMEEELGGLPDIAISTPTPVVNEYLFDKGVPSPSVETSSVLANRKRSARLYNDHIFCATCTGDLIVI